MNVNIEKAAVEYIKKHSKDSSVILHIKSEGNCCIVVQSPEVLLGKPEKAERFDIVTVNEINIYISKSISVRNDNIRIFVRKFLWIEDLVVDGLNS